MSNPFFDHPILNSPYECPRRHWELDPEGQPTQRILENRRRAEFITPIPKPKKRKKATPQDEMVFDEGKGISTKEQQYDPTSIINEVRQSVDSWRALPNPNQWQVSPETTRLLQHWRHQKFGDVRPFFCQVEAVETAIWLTEVAPQSKSGKRLLDHLASANKEAEKNNEAARLWISGLEAVNRKLGLARVIDLSATPFFLRGSGYAEGTLFPWTMSDFSLMDGIECGIVKLPRVPVAENIPGDEMPVYRNLWENIRKDMPKKGRGQGEELDPLKLPTHLQTALQALYGQLKRITKQWLDTCLVCKGGTYPAQLKYQELADMACNKITAGITRALEGKRPIKALLDPYNPTGSTAHVRFNTSRTDRWETSSKSCHINWVVLDSDWEAEFCRVAESHPKVRAYVKNHNLGLEVPYRYGSEIRKYLPDFIVLVDDGHGPDDPLHLVVEIKGYRREDAKEKKSTMETYWVPGVNNLKQYGRWAFAEFCDIYEIESDFKAKVQAQFNQMIAIVAP